MFEDNEFHLSLVNRFECISAFFILVSSQNDPEGERTTFANRGGSSRDSGSSY